MKWRGRRQSTNIEEEAPLDPKKWLNKFHKVSGSGGVPNNTRPKRPPPELPELPETPTPIEGSEFADLAASSQRYQKDAVRRGAVEGWMDATYNKRDKNYKHSNFKRGGMIKGKQCRDYGK